jgi:hypothetical protein
VAFIVAGKGLSLLRKKSFVAQGNRCRGVAGYGQAVQNNPTEPVPSPIRFAKKSGGNRPNAIAAAPPTNHQPTTDARTHGQKQPVLQTAAD